MALKLNKKDASGEPKPPKEKKELTEEQVKMRNMLIVVGILAVITAAIYVPPMFSSRPSPPVAVAPEPGTETENPPPPEGQPVPAEGEKTPGDKEAKPAEPKPTATPLPGGKSHLALVGDPVRQYRRDPFEPFYSDIVLPNPTPTPIPSVPLPMPRPEVRLPRPGSRMMGNPDPGALIRLPPVHISRISTVSTVPAVQQPFKRITGKGNSLDPADATPSYNKRLSGIVIGDGVRALLEINNGDAIVTRVVQPGDQVDGITVLSIQRVTVGNQTVTRMLIRENGEERYVDLKPSPNQQAQPPGGQAP